MVRIDKSTQRRRTGSLSQFETLGEFYLVEILSGLYTKTLGKVKEEDEGNEGGEDVRDENNGGERGDGRTEVPSSTTSSSTRENQSDNSIAAL